MIDNRLKLMAALNRLVAFNNFAAHIHCRGHFVAFLFCFVCSFLWECVCVCVCSVFFLCVSFIFSYELFDHSITDLFLLVCWRRFFSVKLTWQSSSRAPGTTSIKAKNKLTKESSKNPLKAKPKGSTAYRCNRSELCTCNENFGFVISKRVEWRKWR